MADSSKMFIEVEKPFWEDLPDKTQCIITDQLGQMCYGYQYPDTGRAVVLVSYAWENSAKALQMLEPKERLELIRAQIAKAHPEYAKHLVPAEGSEIRVIDWQNEKFYRGAFSLEAPDQVQARRNAFGQFKSVLADDPQPNSGVTIANDALHHGGWLSPGLRTSLNAACAALHAVGGQLVPNGPLEQETKLYKA